MTIRTTSTINEENKQYYDAIVYSNNTMLFKLQYKKQNTALKIMPNGDTTEHKCGEIMVYSNSRSFALSILTNEKGNIYVFLETES